MSYTLENFYKYVAPSVRQCPMPVVEEAVRDAIIRFCQRSNYWRMWLDDNIFVYEDDESVEIDMPDSNTRLVDVLAVQKVNDDGTYGDYLDKRSYVYAGFDTFPLLMFNDPAEEDFEARLRVSLAPDVNTNTVQNWVYEDFREVICHGALADLQGMSSKPWYSMNESMMHRQRFNSAILRASAIVAGESVNTLGAKTTGFI